MKLITALCAFILAYTGTANASLKIGLSVGYSPNYMVNLSGGGTSSGTPYNATYALNYNSTTEFGIDVWSVQPNSWGFISGYQNSGARKFYSGTANGFPIPSSSDTSTYQTHFLYGGTAYRWESFYIPLALTYGMTKFTEATSSTSTATTKNGVGAHLGMGWFFNENFVIEYIGRSATTELKATGSSGSETTTGTVASALLSLKYFF
ncbi:hypothetical protein [Bdellovibrio sp. HCB337]|uniref:hypothetical protein n=1 Tax=Bdellovibrio sp. HCB337 TaxID=3394358 RepID=UPI0039A5718C